MRARRIATMVFGGVVAVLGLLFAFLQTPPGQRALAGLASDETLHVSGLSGFFPTDLQAARIELLDEQGPWLTVENARLRWSFASLFEGRVRVEMLSAALVDVVRAPLPQKTRQAEGGSASARSSCRSASTCRRCRSRRCISRRRLPAWTRAGRCTAMACCPPTCTRAACALPAIARDGPSGKLAVDTRFDLVQRTVDGEISVEEGPGGVTAGLLQRPDLAGVSMRLVAKGDATAGNGELTVSAGDAVAAKGSAHWQPSGAATAVSVRLEATGKELPYAGPILARRRGDGGRQDGDLEQLQRSRPDRTASPPRAATIAWPIGSTARRRSNPTRRARSRRSSEASPGAACVSPRTPCSATWRSSPKAR